MRGGVMRQEQGEWRVEGICDQDDWRVSRGRGEVGCGLQSYPYI